MPRTCTICQRADREAIEAELLRQSPLRDIALRFSTSTMALSRHRKHLSERLLRTKEAEEQLSASVLLRHLAGLHLKALELLRRAEQGGDLRTALLAVGQARQCIEAAAKILEQSELEQRIEALEEMLGGQDGHKV